MTIWRSPLAVSVVTVASQIVMSILIPPPPFISYPSVVTPVLVVPLKAVLALRALLTSSAAASISLLTWVSSSAWVWTWAGLVFGEEDVPELPAVELLLLQAIARPAMSAVVASDRTMFVFMFLVFNK